MRQKKLKQVIKRDKCFISSLFQFFITYQVIISITTQNIPLPVFRNGNYFYYPHFVYYIINNLSIPISWVIVSNSVLNYDNFVSIGVGSTVTGNISWYAVSNSTNYGGPYIGSSFSANVNWPPTAYGPSQSSLKELDSPIIYVYYNATIAVAQYEVFVGTRNGLILVSQVVVTEVTWANPSKLGSAVENSNGVTEIYVNGQLNNTLTIGNGTVYYYLDYMKSENNLSVDR